MTIPNVRGRAIRRRSRSGWLQGCYRSPAQPIAERGTTERQLMAIFGWWSGKQASYYTKSADQKRLAAGAMHLLSRNAKQAKNKIATPSRAKAKSVAKREAK